MLVMTRKENESIVINEEIEIMILECDSQRVKIGIQAPKSIKIIRKEVIEAVKSENKQALNTDLTQLSQIMNLK